MNHTIGRESSPPTAIPVTLKADPSVLATAREVRSLLKTLSPTLAADIVNQILDLGVEFFRIEQDPALRAGELRLNAHPSGRVLKLVSALRAGDVKCGFAV